MSAEITQVIAAVIGGLLAAGTGWFIENRKDNARLRRARELIITGISDDLQHSVELYEKISDEWEKSRIIWFSSLNELKESRSAYMNHKNEITLFGNPEIRKRLFKYYLQSGDLINSLEYFQHRRYELERRFNDILRDIKFKNPSMTQDEVMKISRTYMENEEREYRNQPGLIAEGVQKLKGFRTVAEKLLQDIKQSA